MADFTPEIADAVLATIRDDNEEVAAAFGRALDGEFTIDAADAAPAALDALPDPWQGAGLAVALAAGDESGALLLLPQAGGLVPTWCAEPDATGESKLATLALELDCLLLPESVATGQSKASYVDRLADTVQVNEAAEPVTFVPITVTQGEQSAIAHLVWPIQNVLAAASPADTPESASDVLEEEPDQSLPAGDELAPSQAASETSPRPARRRIQYSDLDDGIRQLPKYAQSLLRVEVPVTVTLSTTKHTVEQILQLGPGSILKFDKPCEENLELEVGGQTVAEGEAVKVGDKFGLWITAMTVPGERFWVVNGERSGVRVQ